MIAALPMYDWPVLRPLNDALWGAIRAELDVLQVKAPQRLTRQGDYRGLWLRADLLLGQTCGLPYNIGLRDQVSYVASPVYGTEGCDGPSYRSAIVRRRRDGAGARLVINGRDSWSGWVALKHHCRATGRPEPNPALISGGHLFSMQAVAEGRADWAAIDAVCWGLVKRHMPYLAGELEAVDWTGAAPSTPFIASRTLGADTVRALSRALACAARQPEAKPLMLQGVEVLPETDYLPMRDAA